MQGAGRTVQAPVSLREFTGHFGYESDRAERNTMSNTYSVYVQTKQVDPWVLGYAL